MPACKIASFLKLVQNSRTICAQRLPAASALQLASVIFALSGILCSHLCSLVGCQVPHWSAGLQATAASSFGFALSPWTLLLHRVPL